MKSLRRSIRGLSPIFAVLILIAIAVIAGIVVYMFTSGTIASMTGGGTAGQEKMAIQAVSGDSTGITIMAQSTGGGNIVVDSVIVKDSSGSIVNTDLAPTYGGVATAVTSTLTEVDCVGTGLVTGSSYTVTIVSTKGGSFVSPSFVAG